MYQYGLHGANGVVRANIIRTTGARHTIGDHPLTVPAARTAHCPVECLRFCRVKLDLFDRPTAETAVKLPHDTDRLHRYFRVSSKGSVPVANTSRLQGARPWQHPKRRRGQRG